MSTISQQKRATVDASAITYTTHVVHVDLSAMLAGLEVGFADNVVVTIACPSGRDKRVSINPSFLIEPHHADYEYRS